MQYGDVYVEVERKAETSEQALNSNSEETLVAWIRTVTMGIQKIWQLEKNLWGKICIREWGRMLIQYNPLASELFIDCGDDVMGTLERWGDKTWVQPFYVLGLNDLWNTWEALDVSERDNEHD